MRGVGSEIPGRRDSQMTTTYTIEDGNGVALTQGLTEDRVWTVAQELADEQGESVYVWAPGADAAKEIAPSAADA
jgi:hypothetical protein